MLNVKDIADSAAKQFGASLKDDPTAWPEGHDTSPAELVAACQAEAHSNAKSAVARAVGGLIDRIAEAVEIAVHEDGPLADLDGVLAQYVGGLATVDLSPLREAADWDARVRAIKAVLTESVDLLPPPAVQLRDVLAYLNSDPRFDGAGALKKGVAALAEPAQDFTPPAFIAKGFAPEAPDWEDATGEHGNTIDGGPPADTWDDEEPAPAPKRPAGKRVTFPAAPVSGFPQLLASAGVTKTEIAALGGLSVSYVSLIFAGKRPWPGLSSQQIAEMARELTARRDALNDALGLLESGVLTAPDGMGAV